MRKLPFRPRALTLAAALAVAPAVWAQTADEAKKDPQDTLGLERVVVTGTSLNASRMKQSLSTSTLDFEQAMRMAPMNAAEVLRAIPGVRSESSGGEGNANLTVRGLPISAGGARYVQFQEDGLPILMFGDIAFGTADQFLRLDSNIASVEVVRGGSASTMATNSPGGLINFISKDGREGGGSVGATFGVAGGKQVRLDAVYGGNLGNGTRFSIGGFQRVGEGDRPTGFNAANGGQIKASLSHAFDRDNSVRVTLKALDDRTPSFMPVPTYKDGTAVRTVNGIDPRTAYFIGDSLSADRTMSKDGTMVTSDPRDGLRVKSLALGLEGKFKLGGFTISEKFRTAQNSGRFIAMFPADNGGASATVTPTSFTGTLFNTAIDSLDNTFNDLKVGYAFDHGGGSKTTLSGGLFYGKQKVAMTWFWNQYTVQMRNTGATSTYKTAGFDTWGGCCVRNFNVDYTTTSPYVSVTSELGALTLDASVRRDHQKASGYARQDTAAGAWDAAGQQKVNYGVDANSYSVGANWQLERSTALFARASKGTSFSADRLLYGNPLDGSVPIALNQTEQVEAGVKYRAGPFSAFATLFDARTSESNYEATTQKFTANKYKAQGLELELGWRAGDFRVNGGATFTRARITASNDAATVGNAPRRQADVVYQIAPSYALGNLELGGAIIGTGESWADDAHTIKMPGYAVLNLFANYAFTDRLSASLAVNNATNTIGWTEVEGDGHASRSINGRTVKLGVKYAF